MQLDLGLNLGIYNRLNQLVLDSLSVPSSAAYSLRKLRSAYTGNAIRVRRSSDNLETDIGFSTTTQTRTNLAPVPAQSGDSRTVTGITLTTVGTGTEFGQSYIDVRWAGTATANGNLQYGDTILSSSPNSTTHALVTTGETYTCSMGIRLIAGTFPTFTAVRLSPTYRNGASFVSSTNVNLTANPSATLQRASVTSVAPATANYVQNLLQMTGVTSGFTCDFTLRIYAPNTEVGTGNARPLLQRYVPETIANVGDLNVEALMAFVGNNTGFVTTWYDQGRFWNASRRNLLVRTEEFENAVWGLSAGCTITANSFTAPNGTMTADRLNCNIASVLLVLNQAVTVSVVAGDVWTASVWVRNASPSMSFRIFRQGGGAGESTAISIPVSSEWQRISVTHTFLASQTGVRFDIVAPTGVSSVEIWGAQLEQGSTATEYQPILTGTPLNLAQATAGNQPTIVTLGAVVSESGKPSVLNTTTASMQNDFGAYNQPFTRSYVITREDNVVVGGAAHYISNFNSSPNTTEYGVTATTMNMYSGGTPHAQTVQNFVLGETGVFAAVYNNSVGNALTKNGNRLVAPANVVNAANGLNGVRIGGNVPSGGTTGQFAISELMIFTLVLTISEIQTLQRNQGQFFGITVS